MVSRADEITRLLVGFTDKAMKELTIEATANLKEDTPVDTGWARANWIPNVGSRAVGVAGSKQQAEGGSIDNGRTTRGLVSVLGYTIKKGPIHISNNVPYIGILNEGSSAKAPTAFVQRGVDKAIATVSRRIKAP